MLWCQSVPWEKITCLDVVHDAIEEAMEEIEEAIGRIDDVEDDDEIILPLEVVRERISDLDVTDALEKLQNYCRQQKLDPELSNMLSSLELHLRRMQLGRPKTSPTLTAFFRVLLKKKQKKTNNKI